MSRKNRYIFNQKAVVKGWLIKTFLLLLLLFVACGDGDEFMQFVHGGEDGEVVLTINTQLPSDGVSTRTAPTENITSITALAFDRNYELIKVQTSEVVQSTTSNTTGTFKVTVPQRTRRIHFIAKNNGEFTEITESDYGKTDVGLLVNRISSIQNSQDADGISNALHYWQMLDFESAEDLKDLSDELQALDTIKTDDGYQLPLIRNMAKITLNLKDGMTGHIAGILNYNTTGTIVPYLNKDGNNYTFCYQDTTNHELPSTFVITSDVSNYSNLGTVHYLFEEYNDVGDLIYVMCYIDNDGSGTEDAGHFYKVALVKPTFTGVEDKYYYVIRNQAYNINIVGKLDVTLGKTDYSDAVQNGKPINDSEKEQVHLDFEPDEVYMYIGEPGTVTVKIPEGIAELQIGFPSERFDADGVIAKNTAGNDLENSTKTDGNIHISTYDVTGLSEIVLSMNLKSSIQDAISGMELQFIGSGEDKIVNDKLVVHVLKRDALNVTPTAVEIPKTKGNSFSVNVIIPSFDNYDGAYELTVNDKDKKYNITAPGTLVLQDGVYNVEKGQTYTFAFELRGDGTAGDKHTIDFHLDTDYHDYDASTIVTLIDNVVHDQDYEIWVDVDNSTWTGTENSVEFFGYNKSTPEGSFAAGNTPSGFRTDFYDTGANSHKSQSMVMGSDDSFTFTIPEGENRWLTMLVAANSGTPSIKLMQELMQEETEWTTSADADATTVPANYNFGNGEIGTAGRLIRYELKPGTYTLQGSSAEYLLYYMRVTKDKPVMTDVVTDATTSNYTLAWSDGEWNNYTKINDTYFVDDDATTFTPTLTYKGLTRVKLAASSSLNITTGNYSFSDNQGDGTNITYTEVTSNNNGSDNGDIAIKATDIGNESITYNAGTYALNGIANVTGTDYKYAAFYDVLRLNTVGFTVKNTIKLGLYYSWNGDAKTITEYVDGLPYIIGFRMPYSLPVAINADNDTSTPINFTIDSKWNRRESGLGVICNAPNYQLASQQEGNSSNNRVHPRPEWTYKIEWYEVAANTIQPTTTDTDIYFSYGKDNNDNAYITKSPVIATTKSDSEKLALKLDFSSNSENGSTHTLNSGNDFYLRATISDGDSRKYAGAHVRLQGVFSNNTQGGGNSAIHWTNSRKDGSIEYARNSSDGTQLQFKVEAGKTEYEIHWQFVRDDGSTTTPTQFTYTVDNDAYNIENGSESATIVLNGNPNELNLPLKISLEFYRKYSNGATNNNYNLIYGVSRVGLKATIAIPDGQNFADYDGMIVYLQGAFSDISGKGNAGIHWDNSRDSGNDFEIAYKSGVNHDGTQLQFKIENGKTEYDIEWVFKGGSQYDSSVNDGDVGFTYAVSATNSNYTVNGSNVSMNIQRSADILNESIELTGWNNTTFDEIFPIGTNISLTYSKGGIAKFLNGYWQMLHIPEFEDKYESDTNFYIRVEDGESINFVVSEQIKLYTNDTNAYVSNLSSSLVALRIQGNEGSILQSVTVTAPPSAFPQ